MGRAPSERVSRATNAASADPWPASTSATGDWVRRIAAAALSSASGNVGAKPTSSTAAPSSAPTTGSFVKIKTADLVTSGGADCCCDGSLPGARYARRKTETGRDRIAQESSVGERATTLDATSHELNIRCPSALVRDAPAHRERSPP